LDLTSLAERRVSWFLNWGFLFFIIYLLKCQLDATLKRAELHFVENQCQDEEKLPLPRGDTSANVQPSRLEEPRPRRSQHTPELIRHTSHSPQRSPSLFHSDLLSRRDMTDLRITTLCSEPTTTLLGRLSSRCQQMVPRGSLREYMAGTSRSVSASIYSYTAMLR